MPDQPDSLSVNVDRGRGYVLKAYTEARADEKIAFALAHRFYGEKIAAVVSRAMHVAPHPRYRDDREVRHLAGVFGLLHRLVEETAATVDDIRASGLSDDAVAMLDAISPRPGETPRQTALRAVTNPHAVELMFSHDSGAVLFRKPDKPALWWATDPDAWQVLDAEVERRKEAREQARKAESYDYWLPKGLDPQVVPIVWANDVARVYRLFTDHEERDENYHKVYERPRVMNIDGARHLTECYQAGMTPEDYRQFVYNTPLTWKQIPQWFAAGLSAELAKQISVRYGRNAKAAKLAVELTGHPENLSELFRWARATASAEKGAESRTLCDALGWTVWEHRDDALDTPKKVQAAWDHLVAARGSDEQARRLLDLMRIVPVPSKHGEGPRANRKFPDWDGWRELVPAWDETGIAISRIALLIAAKITDPVQATAPDTLALSDEQLEMFAAMNASS